MVDPAVTGTGLRLPDGSDDTARVADELVDERRDVQGTNAPGRADGEPLRRSGAGRRGGRAVRPKVVALVAVLAWCAAAPVADAAPARSRTPVDYVNPFIGTADGVGMKGLLLSAGGTFPGPDLPFGMAQPGPDTTPNQDTSPSGGYSYADDTIASFSMRRMSGAGCPAYQNLPFMPTTAPITEPPVDVTGRIRDEYHGTFTHEDEAAEPGYYRVGIAPSTGDGPIDVALTATRRTAVSRITYPASKTASVALAVSDTAGRYLMREDAEVRIDPARRELTGSVSGGGFCTVEGNRYKLYFVITFDRPFSAHGTWSDGLQPGSTSASTSGADEAGAYVTFDTTTRRDVGMHVALSYVSVEGARRNLAEESAGATFEVIRQRARATWNEALSQIEVKSKDAERVERFYTALYHSLIEPATFSDVDGRYAGMDGQIHTAKEHIQYADFSTWDTYRTQAALLAILRPKEAADIATSMLTQARESGWLPKWSVANDHTMTMTGDSASPLIATTYAFGATDFDALAALRAMVKGATQIGRSARNGYVERPGISEYMRLGYVPYELEGGIFATIYNSRIFGAVPGTDGVVRPWGTSGTTLEYATDDFAISQLARHLGDAPTCATFLKRSGYWRNVFNPATRYMEPRLAAGSFVPGYDATTNDRAWTLGFAEGTGAQYTWMVPFDLANLIKALGGREKAIARLDDFFTELNAGPESRHAYLGDQPTLATPWIYSWLAEPWKAQTVVRRALVELHHATPGGFPGNDDLGTMSAWYVLSALGLYPSIPGSDVLAVTAPLFEEVTVHLPGGDLHLRAPHASSTTPYIRELTIDGRRHEQAWVPFSRIRSGATMNFTLSKLPDRGWAAGAHAVPPSFAPDDRAACEPRSEEPAPSQLGLPARTCVSRRRLTIHLRRIRGETLRRVRIAVDGKPVRVIKGRRWRVPITLAGLPRGRFRVTVTAITRSGRTIRITRHYRTCTPKQRRP